LFPSPFSKHKHNHHYRHHHRQSNTGPHTDSTSLINSNTVFSQLSGIDTIANRRDTPTSPEKDGMQSLILSLVVTLVSRRKELRADRRVLEQRENGQSTFKPTTCLLTKSIGRRENEAKRVKRKHLPMPPRPPSPNLEMQLLGIHDGSQVIVDVNEETSTFPRSWIHCFPNASRGHSKTKFWYILSSPSRDCISDTLIQTLSSLPDQVIERSSLALVRFQSRVGKPRPYTPVSNARTDPKASAENRNDSFEIIASAAAQLESPVDLVYFSPRKDF
ncbi:hypothetical protein KCU61_g658, partial [Aureobasidium melanogenum]